MCSSENKKKCREGLRLPLENNHGVANIRHFVAGWRGYVDKHLQERTSVDGQAQTNFTRERAQQDEMLDKDAGAGAAQGQEGAAPKDGAPKNEEAGAGAGAEAAAEPAKEGEKKEESQ